MLSTLPEKKNLGTTGVRGHTFMTPKKMTNFVTYLYFHVQKRVINLLFKNNRIHKHVTNLKTVPHPLPGRCHCEIIERTRKPFQIKHIMIKNHYLIYK